MLFLKLEMLFSSLNDHVEAILHTAAEIMDLEHSCGVRKSTCHMRVHEQKPSMAMELFQSPKLNYMF